jgi:hypothetical protein
MFEVEINKIQGRIKTKIDACIEKISPFCLEETDALPNKEETLLFSNRETATLPDKKEIEGILLFFNRRGIDTLPDKEGIDDPQKKSVTNHRQE